MVTVPDYRWRMAPDGLATRRQLREMGLRPGGQGVAANSTSPAGVAGRWSPTSTASTGPSPFAR